MERVPVLLVAEGDLKGRRFPVTPRGITLGRESSCDVVVRDKGVSRQHARLLLHNGTVWVQDMGSRNGVFVNRQRVVRHRQVGLGDEVAVGDHVFTLEAPPELPDESTVTVSPPARPLWALPAAVVGAALVVGLIAWLLVG